MNKDAMLAEIEAYYRQGESQPDDLTIGEVAQKLGVSDATARSVMRRLIEQKVYYTATVMINRHVQTVYRKVDITDPA